MDAFAATIEQYRCKDVHKGRRCQLYIGHETSDGTPHAHYWLVSTGTPRRGTYSWESHLVRWDDERSWTEPTGAPGMRWCCMGTP